MRTIVDLSEEQRQWLASVCARDGISRAEAIRRALMAARERDSKGETERAFAATFGLWKDRGIDALEYERQIRGEWEGESSPPTVRLRHRGMMTP